jgi:hypothetical protein
VTASCRRVHVLPLLAGRKKKGALH